MIARKVEKGVLRGNAAGEARLNQKGRNVRKSFLLWVAVLSIILLALPALGQDYAGKYEIKGWDPGSDFSGRPDYEGEGSIEPCGEVWTFTAEFGGQLYFGKGVARDDGPGLALVFVSHDSEETGVTLLTRVNGGLEATWTYLVPVTEAAGREVWMRKNQPGAIEVPRGEGAARPTGKESGFPGLPETTRQRPRKGSWPKRWLTLRVGLSFQQRTSLLGAACHCARAREPMKGRRVRPSSLAAAQ